MRVKRPLLAKFRAVNELRAGGMRVLDACRETGVQYKPYKAWMKSTSKGRRLIAQFRSDSQVRRNGREPVRAPIIDALFVTKTNGHAKPKALDQTPGTDTLPLDEFEREYVSVMESENARLKKLLGDALVKLSLK